MNNIQSLERIDTPDGRFYKTPSGFLYPSVTTILATIPNPELEQWKIAVGEEVVKKVSSAAAHRGTLLHSCCEDFLLHRATTLTTAQRISYAGLTTELSKINPVYIEHQMWSYKIS